MSYSLIKLFKKFSSKTNCLCVYTTKNIVKNNMYAIKNCNEHFKKRKIHIVKVVNSMHKYLLLLCVFFLVPLTFKKNINKIN